MKPFNCLQPVLSFSLATSIHRFAQSYCEATNATTTTILRLLLLYQFWLAEISICHKPCPTRDEIRDLQSALPRTLMLLFFSILLALHIQDTFALILNFDIGHFARHFLFAFFLPSFLLVLLWKEFNPYSFVVTFHFSHSSGSPPVFFYPAGDGCWIHVNVGCSACIYNMLFIVSLNDEPRLAHRRKQSAGSAFQFHYSLPACSWPWRSCFGSWLSFIHTLWVNSRAD